MTGYPSALPAGGGKDVSMAKAEPVPVSVITGFLGSGKTTLLSHLLRRPDMGRTAVIINEFGEVGLDHRSEEHTSELQSLMRISYAVFCLKKKKHTTL